MPVASQEGTLTVRIYLFLGKIAFTVDWNLNREKDSIKQMLNKHTRNVILYTEIC